MNDKKYLVKMYKNGTFQGVLPYVVDDVQYTTEINTAGTEITVKLGTDLKGAGIDVSTDYWIASTGAFLIDSNGNNIITRKEYIFNTVPVDLGNQADIYLYYSGAPNGVRVFSGLVSAWEADEDDASITMTALSWGVQLDNYPIAVQPNANILNYPTSDVLDILYTQQFDKDGVAVPYNRLSAVAQTFTVLSNTSIASFSYTLNKDVQEVMNVGATLQLYSGAPGGTQTFLGVAYRTITTTTATVTAFTFRTPIVVTTGVTYSAKLTIDGGIDTAISVSRNSGTSGAYTGGSAYVYNDSTATWTTTAGDYAFAVTTATGALGNQFSSTDPGAIIVALLDSFTEAGGVVDADTSSVSATGTVVSYTFKSNTVLDGIKKCLELAPPNWYWYVDVGSSVLHFHQYSTLPNHTFIKGLHISSLKVKYSLEDMKNKVNFTGGEVAGVNVVSSKSNPTSIAKYGQWLGTESDSRVTVQSTADLIALNMLGESARPKFSTRCTVLATNYDIETLQLGQMVAFRNFNDLTNSLILQIVSISRNPDAAQLTLATLPPTQTHRIEDIKRNLDAVITANNPAE